MARVFCVLVLCAIVAAVVGVAGQAAEGQLVYIGTYTGAKSKGIYAFRFNPSTGALTPVGLVAETRSPSWLALHPSGRFLYAANEVNDVDADKSGSVSAFSIDPATGTLTLLNSQSSRGAHPCHLAVDRMGTTLLVANYSGGNVGVLPIQANGSLGPASQVIQHEGKSVNPKRQAGPHAHSVDFDATYTFVVSADLGADRLFVSRYDARTGRLTDLPPGTAATPGAGPRHVAFHPNGALAFAINEIVPSVTSYAWDAKQGVLKPVATISTEPAGAPLAGNSTAEIRVHPSGRFVYGSNRGRDDIAVYRVEAATGQLTLVEHEPTRGKTPRNFTIDPSGRWLIAANQNSDTLAVFSINDNDGTLTAVGPLADVGAPVSVVFVP